jgi:hypothetical protein
MTSAADNSTESKRQVRRLLMEWDPIGVSGIPDAADECTIT